MIGMKGSTVEKYTELIKKNIDPKFESIEFIETDGIV